MKVRFWGTRGSIAVPGKDTVIYGGNTCCLDMTLDSGRKIIIDAGTGIRSLGDHLIARGETVDILLLVTHIHWDHIQGFPFFDPIFNPSSKIAVDGFPASLKGLRAIFDNKMGDGFFPVSFEDLKARIDYVGEVSHHPVTIDNTRIDAIPLNHPQGGFGFRFQEGNKRLVFITDNELVADAPAGKQPDDYVQFCKEADVLIHDAQFTPEEIDNHRGWGHSDCASTLDLALKAHARRLILFHHAPARKDADVAAIIERCNGLAAQIKRDIIVEAAKEGSEFTL
ncbi:MAG: MBL fold metallo-hydrolase [Deltaproteobacteria bacterium]|nr:MBL fold metallo-hydrolase [Deltaproteobacteria bacterium]